MIGVDFGGTRIKAADVVDGNVARSVSFDTGAGASPELVMDTVARAVRELEARPAAVGLAIPGEVDASGRCWRLPNVPGFEGVSIAGELRARIGCPVTVENDGTCAALGERIYGHGRQHPSFLMVTLGTGIGGGLVIAGAVRRGKNGFAGEIGHIPVDSSPDAPPCACGMRGCVESYAGTRGLLRRYAELGGAPGDDEVAPLAEAARSGSRAALEAFRDMGKALGLMLTAVQNTLDLDAVVFSGGVSQSFDLVAHHVRDALRARRFAEPLAEVPLLVSELGGMAGIFGAAHLPEVG
jgi:glucokinase